MCDESSPEREVRALVVDKYPVVRGGVVALLVASGIRAVEATDAAGALCEVRRARPELVVLELDMTVGAENRNLCAVIKALPWQTRVLVYTGNVAPEGVVAALSAGADSYVHKSAELGTVVTAVNKTLAGERVWLVNGQPDQQDPQRVAEQATSALTKREKQVLTLLLSRYSNAEIAAELAVAHQTVKNSVSSILRKLGVHDRRELLRSNRNSSTVTNLLNRRSS